MLDVYMMSHNYRFKFLDVTNHVMKMQVLLTCHVVSIFKYEYADSNKPFCLSKQKKFQSVNQEIVNWQRNQFLKIKDTVGKTLSVELTSPPECNSLNVSNSEGNE